MSDTITITLKNPIEHDGKQFQTLTFREATTGDACNADLVQGDFQKMLAVLAGMAGVPLQVMRAIPMREFNEIVKQVTPLMGE